MMADVATVLWKEGKEILSWESGRGKFGVLIFIAVFGIFLPLQFGRAWIESPIVLAYWLWVPLFLVNSVIADSIAGERERHTLETLLASRLSDRAILFGKVVAAVAYGVGMTWASLLLGLVTANVAFGGEGLILYSAPVALGIVLLSVLGAGLSAGAGVLVSLRAATVRQAQQTLSIVTMLLLFVPAFGTRALPAAWRARFLEAVTTVDVVVVVAVVVGVLVLVDAALLAAAMARFQRSRLILE